MILLKLANHARCLDQAGRHDEADAVLRMMHQASGMRLASAYDDSTFDNELVYSIVSPLGYKIVNEKVKIAADDTCPAVIVQSAYTLDDHYIGSLEDAQHLFEKGIKPELASPDNKVCSIGFSDKLKKYFGWSHRAIKGFEIGDKYLDEFADDEKPSKIINTMEEAKQAAKDFADSVS